MRAEVNVMFSVEETTAERSDLVIHLGDLYTESGQTLENSFAAVSKPIFVPKYAF